jgi:transcriptional antiterminator NusG
MLGKVDELAVNADTRSIPLIWRNNQGYWWPFNFQRNCWKINEERKLEVMVKIFGRKRH